jgi:alpha-methylacyl-CoA racemase
MHLADLGADVIKIEDTGAGDYARSAGAVHGDISYFPARQSQQAQPQSRPQAGRRRRRLHAPRRDR